MQSFFLDQTVLSQDKGILIQVVFENIIREIIYNDISDNI